MTDIFSALGHGFAVAVTPLHLLFCLIGAVCGTLIGVLPGLGPVATISLLLPATYALDPISAIIMLAGIYYGAQYGGSTTAILVNIPGESTSVVTAIDGYKMAQQGRAGEALAIAAIGSFIAGCFGTLVIAVLGPPLALMTQKFASPEYFSLMVLGLVSAVVLANGSAFRAVAMIFLGLLLGMVGMDINTGEARMTFGLVELSDGINFVALVMGLFGVAEVIANLEEAYRPASSITPRSTASGRHSKFFAAHGQQLRGVLCLGHCLAYSLAGERRLRHSRRMRLRSACLGHLSVSAKARSKVSPAQNPPITRPRRLLSSRC